ncbi:hypothetical protein T439DRAFT_10446 [Meredithblackwellia eburnea MCA 4105]
MTPLSNHREHSSPAPAYKLVHTTSWNTSYLDLNLQLETRHRTYSSSGSDDAQSTTSSTASPHSSPPMDSCEYLKSSRGSSYHINHHHHKSNEMNKTRVNRSWKRNGSNTGGDASWRRGCCRLTGP